MAGILTPDERGEFTGYASVWNVPDLQGDVTLPGCVVNLPQFLREGPILWGHDTGRVVGFVLSAIDDGAGLLLRARFHGTADAQEARKVVTERAAAGKPFGLSIGYLLLSSRPTADRLRALERIYLLEVSLAAIPSNTFARVGVAKQFRPADLTPAQRLQVEILREQARAAGVPV